MNNVLAGLVAGVPLAAALALYMVARGRALVAFVMADEGLGQLTDQQLLVLFAGMFVVMGLVFGVLSGLLYGWLGDRRLFVGVVLGLGALLSLLALLTRTPMVLDKVIMNALVAVILGGLVPVLVG